MINVAIIEGYVTGTVWTWGGDLFFRLASYRDPHLPHKPAPPGTPGHDQGADYVTIRVIGAVQQGLSLNVHSGQRVRIHGFLASRSWRRTLAEVVRLMQGESPSWPDSFDPTATVLEEQVIDLVVERIVTLEQSPERARKS